MNRNIRRFIRISLGRYAALTRPPDGIGYSTPLHRRKGIVAMVLGSALTAAVCRQRQGRIALPMLTIEPECYSETPYRQEHTSYDIYDIVVTQVDRRDYETHRHPQQGVEQPTLVPCRQGQDNDGYRRMTTGERVALNTFKGI